MGRWSSLVVLSLVVTACGGGDTVAAPTTSSTAATPTSTPPTATTGVPVPAGPVTLDGPGPVEPGLTHAVDFFVPLEFNVNQEGWVARFVFEDVLFLSLDDDALVFLALTPGLDAGDVIGSILDRPETINAVSDPSSNELGPWAVTAVDVLIPEHPTLGCGNPRPGRVLRGGPPGSILRTVEQFDFGITQCLTTRIWAMDVGGQVVTVLGAAEENDRFNELMPIFEDFLANNVTFGEG